MSKTKTVIVKLPAEARASVASWFTQKMQAGIMKADKVVIVYDDVVERKELPKVV